MKVLLIRHGETQTNVAGTMHRTGDKDGLTDLGKRQAKQTAEACREQGVDMIYSSPETRALETAEIVAQELGLEVHALDQLHERDWGEWEGKSFVEIRPTLDGMSLEERYTFRPPGGETWQEMDQRLFDAIEHIVHGENKVSAVVTHTGAIRALIPLLLGEQKQTSFQYDPANASMTSFSFENGKFRLISLLDTSHLK
jgi:broad specificity phosphatase PhoE